MNGDLGQTVSGSHSPSGNVVGVPVGVDVNAAHAHVLLCALVGVDVVISKNDTPSPGTVDVQNMKIFILPRTYPVWQLVLSRYPRTRAENLYFTFWKIDVSRGSYRFY